MPDEEVEETTNEPDIDDLGVPYEDPNNQEQEQVNAEVELNPAWEKLLGYVPEDKRSEALPILKEWDGNFAKVQSKFAPYNPLLEHNVTMQDIEKAFKFANMVNTNPKELYDELGRRFGFGQGQQQVEEKKEKKDQEEDDLEIPDITKHPQFQQMQQAYQSIEERMAQQAQVERNARIEQEINQEFVTLQREIGSKGFSDKVKSEILRRAAIIGDMTGDYSIKAGYKDYANFVNEVRNSRANNTAPSVMGGSGALPAQGKSMAEMTDDERSARIVAFLQASNKEQ